MEKLDDEAAAKFISALTKSVQTLCHGFLDFHTGVEILGYINLNVDKGSKLHYVLEEKVCKNEENSTLFISNSFHAQNQKQDKGKDSESESSGSTGAHRSNSTDNGERSRVSSAISSISTALSRSHEKSRVDSTSSAKDAADMVQSRPISNTSKRKASDDLNSDIRSAKSSHMRSSPSPVSHFLSHSQSPHGRTGRTSPIDRKPSVSELRGENSSGTVLPQTAGISGDGAGDLGVNLAGSVLERVDDHSNSDLPDRGDDSDGDLEVTFIKEEYMEGEQSSCQFENSTGQFGRGTNRRASSTDNMPDASLYPISLHPSASATYVPGSQDMASAQHYGPSTSSQPGASGVRGDFSGLQGHQARWLASESIVPLNRKKQDENIERQNKWALNHFRGTYPAQSDSSACDQKMLEASQLFQDVLQHYKSNRGRYCGFKVDFSNYKILKPSDPLPEGYEWLVEGCGIAIPSEWLKSVLTQCSGRSPSFLLTMIINGMVRPWEVLHGGTSAYAGTYMEPVINALKSSGSHQQPPHPLPQGMRPGCGYVHPTDAQAWLTQAMGDDSGAFLLDFQTGKQQPHRRKQKGPLRGVAAMAKYNTKEVPKETLERLLDEKMSLKQMAVELEISRPTLYKQLRKHGLDSAFKNITNEKILTRMSAIVEECPQALMDCNLMMDMLRQQDFIVGMNRVYFCMQKLRTELDSTAQIP